MGAASPTHIITSSAGRVVSSNRGVEHLPLGALSAQPSPYAVPDWSKRIPALDGLRGIAILMVLMRHSIFDMRTNSKLLLPILTAGNFAWSGVDLFFVLSGFLIGGILLDAKHSPRYFNTFYIRRAFRILPLYYLVTGLALFTYLPIPLLSRALGNHSPLPIPWAAYLTFTQNWWALGVPGLRATWSLCVEEQFYLTIPFVVRKLARSQLVIALVSVAVAAPLLRVLLQYRYPHSGYFCYVLMPCRADALCLGVLSAVLVRNPASWCLLLTKRIWLRGALAVLLASLVYMTWHRWDPYRPPMNTFGLSWIALFYTFVLLTVVSGSRGVAHRALCNTRLMGLGALAYCAYLIHIPLLISGRRTFAMAFRTSASASWFPGGMLGIAATLIIASLSWKFLEKPLLRMGHKYAY